MPWQTRLCPTTPLAIDPFVVLVAPPVAYDRSWRTATCRVMFVKPNAFARRKESDAPSKSRALRASVV